MWLIWVSTLLIYCTTCPILIWSDAACTIFCMVPTTLRTNVSVDNYSYAAAMGISVSVGYYEVCADIVRVSVCSCLELWGENGTSSIAFLTLRFAVNFNTAFSLVNVAYGGSHVRCRLRYRNSSCFPMLQRQTVGSSIFESTFILMHSEFIFLIGFIQSWIYRSNPEAAACWQVASAFQWRQGRCSAGSLTSFFGQNR